MEAKEEAAKSKWLDLYSDATASLQTLTACIDFADLGADRDRKLVLADFRQEGTKLRIYKKMMLAAEIPLIGQPSAVVTVYTEADEPGTPAIAVASASSVYLYKNLKPFYKFTLPEVEINAIERQIWQSVGSGKIEPPVAWQALEALRQQVGAEQLTHRSNYYLSLEQEDERTKVVAECGNAPLSRRTSITCATSLKKALQEPEAEDFLLLCTENAMIHVLDCHVFKILRSLRLPDVGSSLVASGAFDVDYRVFICCRNGCVYAVRRTTTNVEKPVIALSYRAVGLTRVGKAVVIGTMDNTVRYFTSKGRKLYSRKLPANIITMNKLEYSLKNFEAAIISLNNRTIHIYSTDATLVDLIQLDSVARAVKFGKFGREEGALVINTDSGALMVKLLKRSAKLDSCLEAATTSSKNQKLPVPKKSKLAVDQAVREREQYKDMHRQFQVDMLKLRLKTAEAYETVLSRKLVPTTTGDSSGNVVKLSAQVFGFGPRFLIQINLNSFSTTMLCNLCMCVVSVRDVYQINPCTFSLPAILPKRDYKFKVRVTVVSEEPVSEEILISVYSTNDTRPLLTTAVTMPIAGKDF